VAETAAAMAATVPAGSALAARAPAAPVELRPEERRMPVMVAPVEPAARPEPVFQAMQSLEMAATPIRARSEVGVAMPLRRRPEDTVAPLPAAMPIPATAVQVATLAQVEMQPLAQVPPMAVLELAVTESAASEPAATAATRLARPTAD